MQHPLSRDRRRASGRRWAAGLLVGATGGGGCVPPSLGNEFETQSAANTVTVYDVRRGLVESGASVRLDGLVATTPRGPDDRELYVQDPAGGPESGIRVELEHPSPGLVVATGDAVSLRATVLSRYGERYLMVESLGQVAVGPGTPVVPSPVSGVVSWDAWNGVVIELDAATVTGCGDARGVVPLDVGVGLDPRSEAVSLGTGDALGGLVALVTGRSDRIELWLRPGDGPASHSAAGGCATTVAGLRATPPSGRVALPAVVLTAVGPTGLFLQDPDPAGATGVELVVPDAAALAPLAPGDQLALEAVADQRDGRQVLRLDQPGLLTITGTAPATATALAPGALFDTDGAPLTEHDGALVSLGALGLTGSTGVGRVGTEAGIFVDDALYDDIPETGDWELDGVLRVDADRVLLLPRGPEDLRALAGDTGG